jgi:hypothetical protein
MLVLVYTATASSLSVSLTFLFERLDALAKSVDLLLQAMALVVLLLIVPVQLFAVINRDAVHLNVAPLGWRWSSRPGAQAA